MGLVSVWSGMGEEDRATHIRELTELVGGLLERELPQHETDMGDLLERLATVFGGYREFTDLLLRMWANKVPADQALSTVPTLGPAKSDLVDCGCEVGGTDCSWCAGTGKLSHRVKLAKTSAMAAIGEVDEQQVAAADAERKVEAETEAKRDDEAHEWTSVLMFLEKARELGVSRISCKTATTGVVNAKFLTPHELGLDVNNEQGDEDNDGTRRQGNKDTAG